MTSLIKVFDVDGWPLPTSSTTLTQPFINSCHHVHTWWTDTIYAPHIALACLWMFTGSMYHVQSNQVTITTKTFLLAHMFHRFTIFQPTLCQHYIFTLVNISATYQWDHIPIYYKATALYTVCFTGIKYGNLLSDLLPYYVQNFKKSHICDLDSALKIVRLTLRLKHYCSKKENEWIRQTVHTVLEGIPTSFMMYTCARPLYFVVAMVPFPNESYFLTWVLHSQDKIPTNN